MMNLSLLKNLQIKEILDFENFESEEDENDIDYDIAVKEYDQNSILTILENKEDLELIPLITQILDSKRTVRQVQDDQFFCLSGRYL